MREQMTFPIDGKTIIFDKLQKGDCLLFLYGGNDKKLQLSQSFRSFICNGLKNDESCLYTFDSKNNRLSLDSTFFKKYTENGKLHIFPMDGGAIDDLNVKLREMYDYVESGKHDALRLLIDFGNLVSQSNAENIIDCEKRILRKSKEFYRRVWTKAKYRHGERTEEPFPLVAISAFDVTSLDRETMSVLIGLHEKIVISTPNEFTVVLPNFSLASQFDGNPSIDAISQEAMKQSVRKNLESIALSILQKEPMCGYDVIKTISHQYRVFLSQATVYPLLYSLEKKGLLETKNDGRAKIYAPTERGKNIIASNLDEFTKAQEYLYNSIKTTPHAKKKLNHFSH